MVRARKRPPADNRGGARQGQPGTPYPNRSDLRAQKISVPPSKEYGQGEALRRSQQEVPMAGPPAVPQAPGGPGPQGPMAGQMGDLLRPTERPDEPVTAGAPFGPGAAAPQADFGDPVLAQLQAFHEAFPTQDMADLIEDLMMQKGWQQ